MKSLLTLAGLLVATTAVAAPPGDPVRGEKLHAQQCVSCHVRLVGGDGSDIYTRIDRKIESLPALAQRVSTCNAMTNAGWLDDEEADVTAYLARTYYKFDQQ